MAAYKFVLDGLNCANCAQKIETAVAKDKSTEKTALNFVNKTISFNSTNNDAKAVQKWLQNTVNNIEDGVVVKSADNTEPHKQIANFHISPVLKIILSLVFFGFGILFQYYIILPIYVYMPLYALCVLLCGLSVIINGAKALFKLKLDENALMAIAVTAAFATGEFTEAALVTLLFSIGEALEDRAVEKSRKDIAKLAEIRPDTACLVTEAGEKTVPAESVNAGDTITVKPFERIPLDCTVTNGLSSADASALTGESIPVAVSKGSCLLSGMINGEGLITAQVTKNYENSTASRIIKMVEDSAAAKGSSEKFITKFAKIYTPVVILLALLLMLIPTIIAGNFMQWLARSLVFLVASCPCSIVISVPLGFYAGIGGATKAGILIKGGKYLEALAKSDSFVFDKTGTLTTGKLSVSSIKTDGSISKEELIALAAAAEQNSVHPAAYAIKTAANGLKLPVLTDYREIPGLGVSAVINGKSVKCGNQRILKGLKGEAGVIYVTINDGLAGSIRVSDTIRQETPKITKELKELGAKNIVMLTGDGESSAKAIAQQCTLTDVHYGLLPQDKVSNMSKIKHKSRAAVFVGDGINDAPVLAAADCGIAMGLGSEAAIEAADAVLTSGNLKQLPTAVRLARRVIRTVKANIAFSLAVKTVILVLAAFGIAPMWLAVFADTGVCMLCVLYSTRLLNVKKFLTHG